MGLSWNKMPSIAKHSLKKSDLNQSYPQSSYTFYYNCKGKCMELCQNWHALMLIISQIQTFTQKSDFFQTTFELKVWIQTFAEKFWPKREALHPHILYSDNYSEKWSVLMLRDSKIRLFKHTMRIPIQYIYKY